MFVNGYMISQFADDTTLLLQYERCSLNGISFFVTFPAILQLSHDKPVVTGGGKRSTWPKPPPSHWQLSRIPLVGFRLGQWREIASSQWQRLRPHGHQGSLHVNFLLKSRLWLRKAKNNCKQPRKAKTSCEFPIRTLSYLKSRKWDSTLNDFLKIAALATKS